MSYVFVRKNSDGSFTIKGHQGDLYLYLEHHEDTLRIWWPGLLPTNLIKPIIWAQEGRYGWISKEQVTNMLRRQIDSGKQQKGYAKDKPLDLAFHWDDTTPLDPATVRLMREIS